LIALRENRSDHSHSSLLTVYVDEVIKEAGITLNDLDAVTVSEGPGSYTGLRIGVSAAKGFCYALDIPLIAMGTLISMTTGIINFPEFAEEEFLFCPMLDARRMEVYCAIYNKKLETIKEITAEIIDVSSFSEMLAKNKIIFFGDGAEKCKELLQSNPNAFFMKDVYPSAKNMISLSLNKFSQKQFEDVVYFEPFYLKEFVAGKPNVKGLK
jgi:tRNA threonylcarbamoyladenosine biosynthesis protein TsaB